MSGSRFHWTYPILTLVVIAIVAALSHQSEGQRLRQVEQEAAASLKWDLERAFSFAVALQNASSAPPRLSATGDTVTFTLPVAGPATDELRIFVDPNKGGLWLSGSRRTAEMIAATVDGFNAALDARSDGRPMLWMEFSARLSRGEDPPLRHHLYRSILLAADNTHQERG